MREVRITPHHVLPLYTCGTCFRTKEISTLVGLLGSEIMPRESDKVDITPNDRVHKAARDMTPDLKSIIRSIERRDFETAHKALNAYTPAPEHQDFAHYLRGVTCAHLAHFDDAITAFQRCCLPSAPTEWWSNFGVCAKDAGHWKALTEVAQELNRREANDAQSLLVRIEDSRRHCRFEDA